MALAFLTSACPSPSIYGTARTTPVGQWSNTVSAEGVGILADVADGNGRIHQQFEPLPTLPNYQLRYGAWDGTDVGFRVVQGGSFGLDVKHCFIKGDLVDLAIDPMVQPAYWPTFYGSNDSTVLYAHLPLIVDFNVSKSATVLLTPGVMYAAVDGTSADIEGAYARFGIGINARISEHFAVQPEFTALKSFSADNETPLMVLASFGFNFGALPSFGTPESGGTEH